MGTLFALLSLLGGCKRHGVSATEYESELSRVLPTGTSQVRVGELLDSLHIERSPYDARTRTMNAIVRNVEKTLTTSRSLQIHLEFDEQGGLVRRRVTDVATGL